MRWLLLFVGGGLGTILRAFLSAFVQTRVDDAFPWGVLAVNLAGCLGIGFLFTLGELRGPPLGGENARLFFITGLLGGFTTFSAFGLDLWRLLAAGEMGLAVGNAAGSLVGGLVGVALGVGLARLMG